MKLIRDLGFIVLLLSVLSPEEVRAQSQLPLSPSEVATVVRMKNIIRQCAVPDKKGGFNQSNPGNYPTAPVWISVYHVNFMAMALCAEYERSRDPADLELVRKWLEFAPLAQAPEGFFYDMSGTLTSYKINWYVDAWDSSALYIMVCRRYQKAGGRVSPTMIACAKKVLRCVRSLADTDGLTWGKPGYPVKLTEDQMEVFAGLDAGRLFFTAVGANTEALQCSTQVAKMRASLPRYFDTKSSIFAWAKHSNNSYNVGLTTLYPEVQCNLLSIANISPKASTWHLLRNSAFKPDDHLPHAVAGSELWLLAASRMGASARAEWRAKVVATASKFTAQNVYGYRAAWALLGLVEGASFMPSVQSPAR